MWMGHAKSLGYHEKEKFTNYECSTRTSCQRNQNQLQKDNLKIPKSRDRNGIQIARGTQRTT